MSVSLQQRLYSHVDVVLPAVAALLSAVAGITRDFTVYVLLVATVSLYAQARFSRPRPQLPFLRLLLALALPHALANLAPSATALSSPASSLLLLLLLSLSTALLALLPALLYANVRTHLPRFLLFPALWATTWMAVAFISPIGRLVLWSPVDGLGPYAWLRPVFGESALDWLVAAWAVVLAHAVGQWLVESPEHSRDNDDDDDDDERGVYNLNLTQQQHSHAIAYLVFLLFSLMLPAFLVYPSSASLIHSPDTTPLTVACALPLGTNGERPSVEDYLDETEQLRSTSNIILWPEGAVRFDTMGDRNATLESVLAIAQRKKDLLIGVSFDDPTPSEHSQRTQVGRNSLVLVGPNGTVLEYHKRMLVPFVESFSFSASSDPPPIYNWSMPAPKVPGAYSPPRPVGITASICLDFSSPRSFDALPRRPTLILAPARTWHPSVSQAMWEQVLARADEVGSTVLWCDGGQESMSGVAGPGMHEPVQRGLGSWTRTIAVPYPAEERKTLYNAIGEWQVLLIWWALVFAGAGATQLSSPTRLYAHARQGWRRLRGSRAGERQPLLIDI